ncbi:MAG: NAD(P)-dependent alcohol dehydrogenase [Methanotrichaceae archaeon]|nr:NAD(P)-dependent alcohol dehydrogenase [Methanotrichaceae archaeon]
MPLSKAYAAHGAAQPLSPITISRRKVGSHDVSIEIRYCGVCHTDLHYVRNEWHNSIYPLVPGHEIVGRVNKVGKYVTKVQKGDLVAVGCMVGSCQHCEACAKGLEQYCLNGPTWTYNDNEEVGQPTFGGYSSMIVVTENFVIKIPETLDLKAVAPLLCAGITTYSPLRHWKIGKGHKVGIIGLGGLGHMGVKFAKAMGAFVTVFTTSYWKVDDALNLGADEVVLSSDKEAIKQHACSLDFSLSTIPVSHNINPYVELLKRDGTLVILGAIEPLEPGLDGNSISLKRRSVAGSLIGGIRETQEMIDFCARHNIVADVEVIPIQNINEAYERMLKRDVKYRFVIDLASLDER